ncbi:MAG: glycosyltransferase family 2 protein, partial [Spirochaetia bacterium]|nr:glycosyltransferase family 2 protein [Spirochaetia bacterium]
GSSYNRSADSWYRFFEKKDLLEISEIIVVDDGIMRNESIVEVEYRGTDSRINFIGHYMPFGRLTTIRTGMMHATGRYILVDETREGVHPGEIFPLLNAMMHREKNENLNGCALGMQSWDPVKRIKSGRSLRERYAKFTCGSLKPASNFRMFHFQLAGKLFEKNFKEHKIQPLFYLKKNGIPVKDVAIEGTVSTEKDPGMMRLTFLAFRNLFLFKDKSVH